MNTFFSIVIPTFNSENTLYLSIDSVLKQTFADFEILIIDNLSVDSTITLAKGFNDHRIKIYSEKDLGIYDGMNKAIYLAKGNWLYFMGSDDRLYDREVLENISNVLKRNQELNAVYGNVVSSRFGGLYAGEFDSAKLYNQNICHQAIFLKKEVFRITGKFNLKYNFLADYDNNIKWFFSRRVRKKYIDIIVANYADGGYSSLNSDHVFLNDKRKLFLKFKHKLDFDLCIYLLREEYKENKKSKNYSSYLYYKIQVIFLLNILKRIK
jgi:glycosyltransferase involved in cell wall biosynthesis